MKSRETTLVNPFQGRKGDTEIESRPADTVGEERMGRMGSARLT